MNKITKKTALTTTGIAAAALLTAAFAAPAMAETNGSSFTSNDRTATSYSAELSDILNGGDISNDSPVVIAPEVANGDILGGGILNGSAIASGNEVNAPVASGNDTAVGNNSGNGAQVGGDASVGVDASDLVDSVTDVGTTDLSSTDVSAIDVDGMVDDIIGDLGLEGMFE